VAVNLPAVVQIDVAVAISMCEGAWRGRRSIGRVQLGQHLHDGVATRGVGFPVGSSASTIGGRPATARAMPLTADGRPTASLDCALRDATPTRSSAAMVRSRRSVGGFRAVAILTFS
jgi:hypothetical protein